MRIVFPEIKNYRISTALSHVSGVDAVPATSLENACDILKKGEADAMIAGIEYSSRDVILACKNFLGMTSQTFSGCVVLEKKDSPRLIVADVATCKHPTVDQLHDIIIETYDTARKTLEDTPRIALLSFSTKGSGGTDATMTDAREVISLVREHRKDIMIDGEMQLDAAIDPEIAKNKIGGSFVAGRANVLICPDLNSGNILYKSLEYFGGYTAAGPILQGFSFPVSDLSRGSSIEDIVLTIETIKKLGK